MNRSLGASINKHKNGILLAYIANNIPNIHLRKLLKIVYLIDEHFMKMRGFPLTWLDYYAWAKGPVAPEVYEIKNGEFGEFVSSHRSANNKRVVNSAYSSEELKDAVARAFSISEITEINKLIDIYRFRTADELSELTHLKDSLWSKVVAENHIIFDRDHTQSEVLIDLRMLFTDKDIRIENYEDARLSMELQVELSSHRNPQHRIQLHVVSPSERERYSIPVYLPAIP